MNIIIKKPSHGRNSKLLTISCFLLVVTILTGCAYHPHNVDVKLADELPEAKATQLSKALHEFGLMTEIYGTPKTRFMARDVIDNTGSSLATNAEIPRDISEMTKSTLNAIGGSVIYIPYDPDFVINSASTGYSGFKEKLIPNVVVSGGITEFDRGLETRGKNMDLGMDGSYRDKALAAEYSSAEKESVASITLDFNLIDFESLAGISKMQAVNSIKVHKATEEKSIGFSIIGNSIGFQGTVKKIQGRHAAVRLLVQVNLMQIIGKYLKLPYWRLLPNMSPDPVVISRVITDYYAMEQSERIKTIQEYLILNGYPLTITGKMNQETQDSLRQFSDNEPAATGRIDKETYLALFSTIDINEETLVKRRLLTDNTSEKQINHTQISSDGLLRLSTNQSSYRIGDEISIFFAVAEPLYVKIISISSKGEIWNLFPDAGKGGQLLNPGKNYQLPSQQAEYTLKITGPAGEDRIIAIASREQLSTAVVQKMLDSVRTNVDMSEFGPTNLNMRIAIR
jgi:hypothetical protein